MKPTMKLRFVSRYVPAPEHGADVVKEVIVFQQWWEHDNILLSVHVTDKDGNTLPSPALGEWRDIPKEKI